MVEMSTVTLPMLVRAIIKGYVFLTYIHVLVITIKVALSVMGLQKN